jgi:3'-phosphoadenosine 5'-phosphosulfate sulfotransferase (PAPS reductase)/FAD synthetase
MEKLPRKNYWQNKQGFVQGGAGGVKGIKMDYLPGLEPDFDIRQELRFIGGILDLRQFDKVFISLSGGKDSHAMTFLVKEIAEKQGCLDKLTCVYADTGMEWYNAEEQVRKICQAAGIPLQVVYPVRPMLEKFRHRLELSKNGKVSDWIFPSPTCRYCTGHQKVAPLDKFTVRYTGKLLKVTGERWQESAKRSGYAEFVKIPRITNRKRTVYGWRPMLRFKTEDIFQMVTDSGVPRHCAYDMGCGRLGCAGCIYSNNYELKVEMRENPEIFESLDRLEVETGKTMSIDKIRIRDRIKQA